MSVSAELLAEARRVDAAIDAYLGRFLSTPDGRAELTQKIADAGEAAPSPVAIALDHMTRASDVFNQARRALQTAGQDSEGAFKRAHERYWETRAQVVEAAKREYGQGGVRDPNVTAFFRDDLVVYKIRDGGYTWGHTIHPRHVPGLLYALTHLEAGECGATDERTRAEIDDLDSVIQARDERIAYLENIVRQLHTQARAFVATTEEI